MGFDLGAAGDLIGRFVIAVTVLVLVVSALGGFLGAKVFYH